MADGMHMELQHAKCNMLPYVVSRADDDKCSVLDLSTKKFHSLHNEVLENSVCIRTKGDWLLLRDKEDRCAVFLLNIVTGVRIDLPKKEKSPVGFMEFSIISGMPCTVVHVCHSKNRGICIQVICPGDPSWANYLFPRRHRGMSVKSVVLFQDLVLCCFTGGSTGIFNLSDRSWMFSFQWKLEARGSGCFLESDGEALMVFCPDPRFSSFTFSRFDLRAAQWIELDDHELEDMSWFVDSFSAFRVKGAGKKVYTLSPKLIEDPLETARGIYLMKPNMPARRYENVYVHDLVDNSTQSLLPDPFVAKSAFWLDAGFHAEVCKSYAS